MPDPFGLQTPERRDTRSREELVHRIRREFDGLAGLTLTLGALVLPIAPLPVRAGEH